MPALTEVFFINAANLGGDLANACPPLLETTCVSQKRKPRGFTTSGALEIPFRLTLAVLEALAGPGLPVFLTLFHTRIAREKAVRLESWTKIGVRFNQGAGDAVTHGTSLTGRAATFHIY